MSVGGGFVYVNGEGRSAGAVCIDIAGEVVVVAARSSGWSGIVSGSGGGGSVWLAIVPIWVVTRMTIYRPVAFSQTRRSYSVRGHTTSIYSCDVALWCGTSNTNLLCISSGICSKLE